MKPRSFGRLAQDGAGGWLFLYRPWLVLPRHSVQLPPGEMAVLKGALYGGGGETLEVDVRVELAG